MMKSIGHIKNATIQPDLPLSQSVNRRYASITAIVKPHFRSVHTGKDIGAIADCGDGACVNRSNWCGGNVIFWASPGTEAELPHGKASAVIWSQVGSRFGP